MEQLVQVEVMDRKVRVRLRLIPLLASSLAQDLSEIYRHYFFLVDSP